MLDVDSRVAPPFEERGNAEDVDEDGLYAGAGVECRGKDIGVLCVQRPVSVTTGGGKDGPYSPSRTSECGNGEPRIARGMRR